MTEEIEAHVLKKYEILQKLGKHKTQFTGIYIIMQDGFLTCKCREGCLRYCLEGNR